jgi:hypothetical protein
LDATDPVCHYRGVLHMGIQVIVLGPNPRHNKAWRVSEFGTRQVSLQVEPYDPNRTQTRLQYDGRNYYAGDPATIVIANQSDAPAKDPFDGVARFDVRRAQVGSVRAPKKLGPEFNHR